MSQKTVADLLQGPMDSVSSLAPLNEVAEKMTRLGVDTLLVQDGEEIKGAIHRSEVENGLSELVDTHAPAARDSHAEVGPIEDDEQGIHLRKPDERYRYSPNGSSTEEALRSSQARLRTLINTIPDLIWMKDPEGVYLICNSAFERFFGAREQEIVGRSDVDFMDKAQAEFFRANDMAAVNAGGPRRNEEWITFAEDGHRALLDTTKMPILDSEKHLLGVLGIGHDITELRQTESYQSALLDNFPFMVWLKDTESRFLAVNQPYARAVGEAAVADLVGKTDLDYWPRDLAEQYREDDAETMRLRQSKYVEEYVMVDGQRHWHETYKAPVIDQQGELLGTVGFARDISEQKAAQRALEEANTQFRLFYEQAPIAYQSLDFAGRIMDVNPAWLEMLGYRPDEKEQLIGRSIKDFLCADVHAGFDKKFPQLLKQGRVQGSEVDYVRKDGSIINGSVDGRVGHDVRGRFQQTHCVVHNITQRKQSERQLRRFRALLDESRDAIYVIDPQDGRFLDTNPAAFEMTGFTKEEMHSKRVIDIEAHITTMEQWRDHVADLRKQGAMLLEGGHRSKSGQVIPVEVSVRYVQDAEGEFVVAVARDVSERKQAEQLMKHQLDELRSWYDITLGRENRVLELKQEVNALLREQGQANRYSEAGQMQNAEVWPGGDDRE